MATESKLVPCMPDKIQAIVYDTGLLHKCKHRQILHGLVDLTVGLGSRTKTVIQASNDHLDMGKGMVKWWW